MVQSEVILDVQHLQTYFLSGDKKNPTEMRASDDFSYQVHKGEFVAIVGESGSGKSVSALSVMGLIPYPPGLVVGGKILFHGKDLVQCSDAEIESIRGSKISMIFQEPSTALNPVLTIGKQIAETIRIHDKKIGKKEAMAKAVELLAKVNIPNPEVRAKQYPFELSGGMQQRAMIAMAMSCNPEILICDEPTTALDVTVQAQVLEQLNSLREEFGTALVLITHNLGVVARYADSVKVVYGGKIVEEGTPEHIFENPHHPYTLGLIRAVPRLDLPRSYGLHTIPGEQPDMSKIIPNSCAFAVRCPYATDECRCQRPPLEEIEPGHFCACFHKDETDEERSALV
ncbi:MAG: ABC transporter ATP-binding protein [Oscillospiraceae bacterium]|nr:ABC transporter ATP-binding protein [Oscillospiraceae bacterium]